MIFVVDLTANLSSAFSFFNCWTVAKAVHFIFQLSSSMNHYYLFLTCVIIDINPEMFLNNVCF